MTGLHTHVLRLKIAQRFSAGVPGTKSPFESRMDVRWLHDHPFFRP
jgi:hypothetical protein